MSRLPTPGSDNGTWGEVLNDYLRVIHNADGTLRSNVVDANAIQANSVSGAKLQDGSVTNAKLAAGAGANGQVLTKNAATGGGIEWTSVAGSPDATTSTKGIVQLAGDLAGTAASPTVPALADKVDTSTTVTAGTGLTGGGDLTANRTLAANFGTAAGTVAQGNDARIVDAIQATAVDAKGDILAATAADTVTRLGVGSDGQVLTADSSQTTGLRWGTSSGGVTPINGGGETFFDAGNSGAAITLNLVNGNVQRVTLTANCTITLTSPAAGAMRALTLLVFQDGVGSRTITWPGSVSWGNAGAPVLTTTIGKMDMISLFTVDGGAVWYGALGAKGF